MTLGLSSSTPGRAVQTLTSTCVISVTKLHLFYPGMPDTAGYLSFLAPNLGLGSRRTVHSSEATTHLPMPSSSSFANKRWGICEDRKACSLSCHTPCSETCPSCVFPQQERRPRMINDYTYSEVNPDTVRLAPQEAMQWGRTPHSLLWFIFTADQRQGPVLLLSKTDLSDGFYQLPPTPSGALKLAVSFPNLPS